MIRCLNGGEMILKYLMYSIWVWFAATTYNVKSVQTSSITTKAKCHTTKIIKDEHAKRKFTHEEDALLMQKVKTAGEKVNWRTIARFFKKRTPRSLRERYRNYLIANRTEWTVQDENALTEYVSTFGKRWAIIKNFIPGKTDVDCKNHWMVLERHKNLKRRTKKGISKNQANVQQYPPKDEVNAQKTNDSNESNTLIEFISYEPDPFGSDFFY